MKKYYCTLFLLALGFLGSAQEVQLEVVFTNIESDKGQVLMKILNEKDEQVGAKMIKEIKDGQARAFFKLPKGKYGISAFHDENSNEKLDKNFFGIPSEQYGFSNDPTVRFGPPDISEQLFDLSENRKVTITMN